MSAPTIMQLYPLPGRERELEGIYLQTPDSTKLDHTQPWVYTNFITSLDGRIAIEQPVNGGSNVPASITNKRDWRLYQELAARADVLLVSARFLRELMQGKAQDNLPISTAPDFTDLLEWRAQQGLSPQPAIVILSASLDLALNDFCVASARPVYVATGRRADTNAVRRLEESGAKILYAGAGREVDGKQLVEQLVNAGFYNIYSIAGPGVLETLLRASVLDCIYLTQVHRLLGGAKYDTLLGGDLLQPPADFNLESLYYDNNDDSSCGQFFSIYKKVIPDRGHDDCD